MITVHSLLDKELLTNFIKREEISYFSCTLFDGKDIERSSLCNNDEWLEYYTQVYCPIPPVKKYILQKKRGIIWWDKDLYDKETATYINLRNEICATSMICTFVLEGPNGAGAISFGSQYGQEHLINMIRKKSLELNRILKLLLS